MAAVMQQAGRALVVGLGASGSSARAWLTRAGWEVWVTDADPHRAGLAGAAWLAPEQAQRALSEVDLVVASPGVPPTDAVIAEARQRRIRVVGDVELFAGVVQAPIVAVTGTNGKSTVASLVAAMGCAAGRRTVAGGNLGTPVLDLLDPVVELYVLELSSFQLELTNSLSLVAAAVLNVAPDHLDRYASVEAYAAAKARIYAHAGTLVANRDDPMVMDMVSGATGHVVTFGLEPPAAAHYGVCETPGGTVLCRGDQMLLAAAKVPLAGRHNLANVLAGWALGAAAGLDDAAIAEAVMRFTPLAHRLTPVGEHAGVQYLDDSKATNVSAACAALSGLPGPVVVIAGGQGKNQDFTPFADVLAARARAVVLLGRDAPLIERALAGRVPVAYASAMQEAVALSVELAKAGDQVVLAPACASFDMFRNYEERGEAFARAVEALHGD